MDRKEVYSMRRLILSIVLFLPLIAKAEHLFEMGVHGGIAGLSSQPVYVHSQIGIHGGAQLYYNYLSPYVIGFRTGITFDGHNAGFERKNYEDHYSTIDVENEQIDVDYTIGKLSEYYTTWSVGVPLQLAFYMKNILFLAGGKAVFPVTTSWKQTVRNAALSVYYPTYDNRVYESYPLAASRNFDMFQDGKINLPKVQWWLSAELSYTFPLNNKSRRLRSYIVVGAYFDYCLSKHTPDPINNASLIMLTDTRDGFSLQRILTPILEANRQGRKLVNDYTLFDAGIKISYAISPYKSSLHNSARQNSSHYNSYDRSSYPCRCLGVW